MSCDECGGDLCDGEDCSENYGNDPYEGYDDEPEQNDDDDDD